MPALRFQLVQVVEVVEIVQTSKSPLTFDRLRSGKAAPRDESYTWFLLLSPDS
jgi:hypothetical protein